VATRKRRRSSSHSTTPRRRSAQRRPPSDAEEAEEAIEQLFLMGLWKLTEEARADNARLRQAIADALEVIADVLQ
jgi:hypothetical protein